MNINSARELKLSCLKRHLDELPTLADLWVSGRSRRRTRKIHPTIAFGIHHAGNVNYHLPIRVQNRTLLKSPQLASFIDRAHGEADVRYIGST